MLHRHRVATASNFCLPRLRQPPGFTKQRRDEWLLPFRCQEAEADPCDSEASISWHPRYVCLRLTADPLTRGPARPPDNHLACRVLCAQNQGPTSPRSLSHTSKKQRERWTGQNCMLLLPCPCPHAPTLPSYLIQLSLSAGEREGEAQGQLLMRQLSGSHEICQAVSYIAKELQERTQAQGLGQSLWRHRL